MTWTLSQFDIHLSSAEWETVATHWMSAGIMIGTLVIACSYSPIHYVLMNHSQVYQKLGRDQQTVVVTHAIEAIFLSIVFLPFTYLILSLNFESQAADAFMRKATTVGTIMIVTITMYLVELATRYQKPRPLVVFHHLCAFADALFPTIVMSTATFRAASLLVYFITFEAVTFMGLVMYRLCPEHKWTRPVIGVGMLVFGLSRPLQLLWIYSSLMVTWDNLVVWQAVIQMILTLVFTSVQVYSLSIHYRMYQKCGSRPNISRHDNDKSEGIPEQTLRDEETGSSDKAWETSAQLEYVE